MTKQEIYDKIKDDVVYLHNIDSVGEVWLRSLAGDETLDSIVDIFADISDMFSLSDNYCWCGQGTINLSALKWTHIVISWEEFDKEETTIFWEDIYEQP